MKVPSGPAVAVGVLAAATALGASTVLRSGGPPPQPAAATAPAVATAAAGDVPRLRVDGDVALEDTGRAVDVRLRIVNEGRSEVALTDVPSLPSGFTAVLPGGELAVGDGAAAELVLAWAGPDCAADVPQHLLPELELRVRSGSGTTTLTVPSTSADLTLQDAWRATCDENPEDVPEDGATVQEALRPVDRPGPSVLAVEPDPRIPPAHRRRRIEESP